MLNIFQCDKFPAARNLHCFQRSWIHMIFNPGLVGSHRLTHIASEFGIAGARIAGQAATGVRIASISHRPILANMPIFHITGQHCRIFAGVFVALIPVNSGQPMGGLRIASEKHFRIGSGLGVCDSNRIPHRSGIVQFGPRRSWRKTCIACFALKWPQLCKSLSRSNLVATCFDLDIKSLTMVFAVLSVQ